MDDDISSKLKTTYNYLDNYIEKYKRRLKSITQDFKLQNIVVVDVNNVSCYITGASKRIYVIDITSYRDENIKISCTCPDNTYKKNVCKHMYWIASTYIGISELNEWTSDAIDTFILSYSHFIMDYPKGRNDECPICLKDIDYNNDFTVCCTKVCYNSIHATCWYRYYLTTYSNKCVICRKKTLPIFVEYNDAGLIL